MTSSVLDPVKSLMSGKKKLNAGCYKKRYLLSQNCFKSDCLPLYSIDIHFDSPTTDTFEKIVGKGEIARNEQFLLFPQCFLLNRIIVSPFVHIFYIISSFAAELEEPKIGISGKGLIKNQIKTFFKYE